MGHSGEPGDGFFFVKQGQLKKTIMYTFTLTEEQLELHMEGLNSSVKLLTLSLAQSPSSLKELLPELIKIEKQYEFLQQALEAEIGARSN